MLLLDILQLNQQLKCIAEYREIRNNQANIQVELSIDEIAEAHGGAKNRVVAATRMVQKGVMRAGPWGFAAGVVIAIGLEVYERTQ